MKRVIPKLIFIAVISASLVSCYYNSEEKLYPGISGDCDTTNIRYNPTITDILSRNCYSCHASDVASSFGGGVKLDTYTGVKSNIQLIYGAVTHQSGYPAMPKDAPMLDSCTIKDIRIWMLAGTPNN